MDPCGFHSVQALWAIAHHSQLFRSVLAYKANLEKICIFYFRIIPHNYVHHANTQDQGLIFDHTLFFLLGI